MRFNVNKGILENLIYEMEVPEECGFLSYINTENALFAEAKKLEDSPVKSINDLVHFTYIRYALADICNIMIEENEKTRRVNCFGLFISDRDLRNNGLYTAAKSALQKMQKNEKFIYDLHQDLLYLDSVFYRRQHFYIQYKDKATVKNNTEVIDNMQVLYRCIQDWFQPTRTSSIVKILSDMMKVNVNNYLDQSTNQLFLLKVLYAIFAYEYGEKIKSKEDASSTPERGLLLAKIYRNPGLGNIEYYHFFSEEEELFDTAYGQYLDNLKKECVRLTFIDDGNYYSETNKLLMLDNWCELLCRRLYNHFLFIGSLYYTASVSTQLYSEHLKKAQTYAEYVENASLLAESSKIAYSLAKSLEKKTITIIDSACSKLTFFTKNVDTHLNRF